MLFRIVWVEIWLWPNVHRESILAPEPTTFQVSSALQIRIVDGHKSTEILGAYLSLVLSGVFFVQVVFELVWVHIPVRYDLGRQMCCCR